MPLNCCPGLSKFRPREQGQAEVDDRGSEGKEWLFQLDGNRLVTAKPLNGGDQNVSELIEDAVAAAFICVGRSCPGNRAAKSAVVELVPMRMQAGSSTQVIS